MQKLFICLVFFSFFFLSQLDLSLFVRSGGFLNCVLSVQLFGCCAVVVVVGVVVVVVVVVVAYSKAHRMKGVLEYRIYYIAVIVD